MGEVIYGIDFKARKEAEDHRTLEQQAIDILIAACDPANIGKEYGPCETIPFGGAGIDGMKLDDPA